MAASICASALNAVLLLCITWINGPDPAGLYSVAFATATVLNSIADFGMRVYHVTDTERKFSFGVYLSARWVVNLAMIVCGVVYVALNGYDVEKAAICLAFVLFRFVDGLSETYQGEFQLNGRLDMGGKSVCIRTGGAVIVFLIVDFITKNLMAGIFALTLTNLVLFFVYDIRRISAFTREKPSFQFSAVATVIKDCFPLFFSTLLNNYILNVPKYAIDRSENLSYKVQAHFNIIYLPAFTINLLSILALKPMLRALGEMWNKNEHKKFIGIIIKMIGVICLLTVVLEVGCYFLGIPVLSFISGQDLSGYKAELLILMISGGFSALAVVLFYVLTTMRAQGKVSLAYGLSAVVGLWLPDKLVAQYGVGGAAASSVIMLGILCLGLFLIFLYEWKRKNKL